MSTGDTVANEPSSSRKPLYEGSTQYRNWRYSPEQLHEMRASLNAAAVASIKDAFETDLPGSSSQVAFLTSEDEHLLVKLYIGKVSQLCGHFRFPEEVEATAVTYLKRFYLKNTVMDWHPKNVMLTALFLATKTTNHPISLEAYASSIPKTAPSDVLDLEFLVAQSLDFEFNVWHAYRSLWGIYLDIQALPGEAVAINDLQDLYRTAANHSRASRLTDAELIYTPSQIALAAFSLANSELASAWARSKGSQSTLPIIEEIKSMIMTEGTGPDVERVREVDKRLRLCKNPEKIVGSKAYLTKKAADQARESEKRTRKAEEGRRVMEANDPFGEVIGPNDGIDPNFDDDD